MSSKLDNLTTSEVIKVMECWDMKEYVDFVKDKDISGRKLMEVSEGIVKMWRPNGDSKKFISFIQDIKSHPKKYLNCLKTDDVITIKETNLCSESQYQTVSIRKISQQENANFSTVEEILKRITAPKSFLYRNNVKRQEKAVTSYVPMDAGTPKKPRKFFRLSSYEYPIFDIKSRFSKTDTCTDRGYYSVKTDNKFYIQKTYKKTESRPKYKSMTTSEELSEKYEDDHFYEDLCYNDVKTDDDKDSTLNETSQVKPRMMKVQELFQSFKLPFFKKAEENTTNIKQEEAVVTSVEADGFIIYENASTAMYDSIHVPNEAESVDSKQHQSNFPVEEYLEPVQVSRDYCDVCLKQKDDSLLGFIMSYFETRFGIRRETNDTTQSEESEGEPSCDREWEKVNMAARPLPIPVENETFYMDIDRTEAENLLMGQPDGTFVLRPSSQPNHAYTLSVSCTNGVHNVGVRRRPDGRLALGYARRGERSFTSVASLLRHHKKRRLLLVAGGDLIGATTLNDTPQYYQTPSNIPIIHHRVNAL